MKIVLIRHGMTEGNYKKRYIGRTDEPLADIKCLDKPYPHCAAVIASPMKRCIETASFIYPDIRPIICDDLRECDFGDFENKSYEELKNNNKYIEWLRSNGTLPFPNGETHDSFTRRCIRGFLNSLPRGKESAAYVIHGGSIMSVMQFIFGGSFFDYQIPNGGMFSFEYDAEKKNAAGRYTLLV